MLPSCAAQDAQASMTTASALPRSPDLHLRRVCGCLCLCACRGADCSPHTPGVHLTCSQRYAHLLSTNKYLNQQPVRCCELPPKFYLFRIYSIHVAFPTNIKHRSSTHGVESAFIPKRQPDRQTSNTRFSTSRSTFLQPKQGNAREGRRAGRKWAGSQGQWPTHPRAHHDAEGLSHSADSPLC